MLPHSNDEADRNILAPVFRLADPREGEPFLDHPDDIFSNLPERLQELLPPFLGGSESKHAVIFESTQTTFAAGSSIGAPCVSDKGLSRKRMVASEDSVVSVLVNLSKKFQKRSPPSRPPSRGFATEVFGIRLGVAKAWAIGVRVDVRGIVVRGLVARCPFSSAASLAEVVVVGRQIVFAAGCHYGDREHGIAL
ncbi:MAG: hypothetical protein WCB27_01750 [Thermoguttaceae bacterium]